MMLIVVLTFSLLGLAILSLPFWVAMFADGEPARARAELKPVAARLPSRFFAENGVPQQPQVPIEALLLQIENHIRVEQAAAETFLESPTAALLHSKTISPFVN
ncbi:MAG TPA: hypothetical protein VHA11_15310 [Bryobacteraceae bacterium]|nr:hypothetical protein [Bryobacteraceae bacterium]